MNKKNDRKRKHHHVWAYYMKAWSKNNRDIFYTTKKNKYEIACDSVTGINIELDFYEMKDLDTDHLVIISLRMDRLGMISSSRNHIYQIIEMGLKTQDYKEIVPSLNNPEIEENLVKIRSNFIEDMHSYHERSAIGILSDLRLGKMDFLDEIEAREKFLLFIGYQWSRSLSFKSIAVAVPNNATSDYREYKKKVEECWWIMHCVYGQHLSDIMYDSFSQFKHVLLINETEVPFITSDQPIINVHQTLTNDIVELEDMQLDLYYPISPNIGYMINYSDRFPSGRVLVTTDIVNELNIKIAKNAHYHIIGDTKDAISPYKKYVGEWMQTVKNYQM